MNFTFATSKLPDNLLSRIREHIKGITGKDCKQDARTITLTQGKDRNDFSALNLSEADKKALRNATESLETAARKGREDQALQLLQSHAESLGWQRTRLFDAPVKGNEDFTRLTLSPSPELPY